MAIKISQLVNDYGSYSGNTLIGEYGARANVPNPGFGGVTGVPFPNITFIVRVNGSDYASSAWLSQQRNGNPYIHKNSVPRINVQSINGVNKDTLTLPGMSADFKRDEGYAEVNAISNISSTNDVLSFINYLLDGKESVDPAIPTFGSFSPSLLVPPMDGRGSPANPTVPQKVTNPATGESYDSGKRVGRKQNKSWLGVYSPEDDMAGRYPGMAFKQTDFDGFKFGRDAAAQSIPPIKEEVIITEEIQKELDLVFDDFTLDDFELEPLDINFDFDFGDFNFGVGNVNPISSGFGNSNMTGLASLQSLANEGGLASTGLQQQYDTGNLGPMQDILEKSGQMDAFNGFGAFG